MPNYFTENDSAVGAIELDSEISLLRYRVVGFNPKYADRLRVNLRLNKGNVHFIDTLDLYSARSRQSFIKDAAKKFSAESELLEKELDQLITYLESKKSVETVSDSHYIISPEEKKEAFAALKSKHLFKLILADFEACGYVGEEESKLFGYIATISRFLPKPLGILIVSRSGAGKSTLQEAITSFVPEEDLRSFTRITAQSLFYAEEKALEKKVLAIAEEDGMQEAMYSIRSLQSDQKLSVSVTRTDPQTGKLTSEENTVHGPVVIMLTTTNPEALDYETRNRFVILTIDESKVQTERILKIQRASDSLTGLVKENKRPQIILKHQNMQRLLRSLAVHNPYHEQLTFASDRLQMRREQKKYLTLIKSIALLRQYQKEVKHVDGVDYIEIDQDDIALANKLATSVLGRNLDELAPHSRHLLEDISKLFELSKKSLEQYTFSMLDLTENLGWSRHQLMQNMKQLVELEYVQIMSGGTQGKRTIYGLNYDKRQFDQSRYDEHLVKISHLSLVPVKA